MFFWSVFSRIRTEYVEIRSILGIHSSYAFNFGYPNSLLKVASAKKMTTSENTVFQAQCKKFFILLEICIRFLRYLIFYILTHEGGPYHTETSPLICRGNQWTSFYKIGISFMKDLNHSFHQLRNLCSHDRHTWRSAFLNVYFES